jgi:DNA-directed RNA polymerase subunit M/transcription elongation factor TFIIS
MDITVTCDSCGQKVTIGRTGNAAVVTCPKCGKALTVPPLLIQTKTMQAATANSAKPVLRVAAPAAIPRPSETKHCPFCGKPMSQETELCGSCGFTPASWNPQGKVEKEPEPERKSPRVLYIILAVVAIALLGITIYLLRVVARH